MLSKRLARVFVCDEPWAAISISTYKNEFPLLNENQRIGLLQLSYADIDNSSLESTEEAYKLFSQEQAEQIWNFLEEYSPKIKTLLVHCEAGISRSPATAAAISKVLNGDDSFYFKRYTPNAFVYRTILESAARRGLI